MKQALLTMLSLQDTMNTKVHPKWREQGNAWYRAIWVECAELLDHYGWKWWKAQQPDMEQVELELIDIWHFGLSIALESASVSGQSYDDIASQLEEELTQAPLESDIRKAVEDFAEITLVTKTFDCQRFATLMVSVGLSFDALFSRYIAKNVLNLFRQDHGYKEGTYRKLWQGREDNEHLMEILSDIDKAHDDLPKVVYEQLQARYLASA